MKRNIDKYSMPSSFLDHERSIFVSLPPGYNELVTYPALYVQDGVDFLTMGRIVTQANQLVADGELDPFIIIGVHVDRSTRTPEYHPHGEKHDAYIRFFAEELVPFIEERYPVRRSREARILGGDSLGATVSLSLALNYDHMFSHVLSLSGAYGPETIETLEEWESLEWLNIYMLIGLEETAVETGRGSFDFLHWNREVQNFLEMKNAHVRYIEKEGVHTWGFWQQEMPDGLKYFFAPTYRLG